MISWSESKWVLSVVVLRHLSTDKKVAFIMFSFFTFVPFFNWTMYSMASLGNNIELGCRNKTLGCKEIKRVWLPQNQNLEIGIEFGHHCVEASTTLWIRPEKNPQPSGQNPKTEEAAYINFSRTLWLLLSSSTHLSKFLPTAFIDQCLYIRFHITSKDQ